MRDPRILGPGAAQRPFSLSDLLYGDEAPAAAPAMAQAVAPPPTAGSRIADFARSAVGAVGNLPPFNIIGALGDSLQTGRQQRALETDSMRLANEQAVRQAQLEQAQLPAQQAQAAAQARQQAVLSERIGQAGGDPALQDSLVRGAASGVFRPFGIEPGPAELAAYQSVLGMKEEDARQKLIGQREDRQARLQADLQRQLNAQKIAGDLAVEQQKRTTGGVGEARQLRSEFEGLPAVKNFAEVHQAYKIIRDLPSTKAGDLTLITKYMKLIDPASSVREGEVASAKNAGGVPSWIVEQYNRLQSGAPALDPKLRQDFVARAGDLYQSYLGSHRNLESQYSDIARRGGFDPRDVVTDFVGKEDAKGPPSPDDIRAELARRANAGR